jgi:hypothetical protein
MTLTITPNSAFVLADAIDPVVYGGNPPETVERMKLAIRLNPHHQTGIFEIWVGPGTLLRIMKRLKYPSNR